MKHCRSIRPLHVVLLALALSATACGPDHEAAARLDATPPSLSLRKLHELHGHTSLVTDAVYSPDERHALTCDQNGALIYWELATETPVWRLDVPGARLGRLSLSRDGAFAAAAGPGNTLLLVDVAKGSVVRRLAATGSLDELAVAFSADGRFLATGASDGFVRIWDLASGRGTVVGSHDWPVGDVAFSADAGFLLAGDPQTIRLWNSETGKEVRRLVDAAAAPAGEGFWLSSLAFSADAAFVVAGSGKDVVLFDLASRQIRQRFKGHTDEVLLARLTPDNGHVLSASRDHSTRLWDVESGAEVSAGLGLDFGFASAIAVGQRGDQFILADANFDIFGGVIAPTVTVWSLTP